MTAPAVPLSGPRTSYRIEEMHAPYGEGAAIALLLDVSPRVLLGGRWLAVGAETLRPRNLAGGSRPPARRRQR